MVGVSGRSKACGSCRRRRVKCDETRPVCRRCVKAKIECTGYPSTTFIHYHWNNNPSVNLPSSVNDRPLQPGSLDTIVSYDRLKGRGPLASVHLDRGLGLNYLQDDIFVAYTCTHLLQGQEHEDKERLQHGFATGLSDQCFLALSIAYFGIEHREKSITERGFRRYGGALTALNAALGMPSRRKPGGSIIVIQGLQFFLHEILHRFYNQSARASCPMQSDIVGERLRRVTLHLALKDVLGVIQAPGRWSCFGHILNCTSFCLLQSGMPLTIQSIIGCMLVSACAMSRGCIYSNTKAVQKSKFDCGLSWTLNRIIGEMHFSDADWISCGFRCNHYKVFHLSHKPRLLNIPRTPFALKSQNASPFE